MSFPIDINIPAANNNPADDQPRMQKNFQNINGYLSIDHVTPGSIGDGFHKEVTLYTLNPPPIAPAGTTSIVFSDEGTASTAPQLYFQNSNNIFQISPIRAFAAIGCGAGGINPTFGNQFGFSTVTVVSPGPPIIYQVSFNTNVVNGVSYVVFVNPVGNNSNTFGFKVTTLAPTSFLISLTGTGFSGTVLNVLVLQA